MTRKETGPERGGVDVAWIAGRLSGESRVQVWRYGDAESPQVLVRTPAMFNNARGVPAASAAWLRVFVLTGRLEVGVGDTGGTLPRAVADWQPHRTPRCVKNDEVATDDLLLWMRPVTAIDSRWEIVKQCIRVEAADREAARQQRRGLGLVREALRNHPARVAEMVLGEPARVCHLVYLSAGHEGGKRRRVLFERYRALGRYALRSSTEEAERVGRAAG